MINRHFRPHKTLVHPESKTVLVLNAKVMTTFLRPFVRAGLKEHYGFDDPSQNRYAFIPYAREWPIAPVTTYADFLLRPRRYAIFAFVRNPYDRVLSAWKNKFYDPYRQIESGKKKSYPPSMRGRELPALRGFAQAKGLPGAGDSDLIPFPTFVAYLESQGHGKRDRHWDLQVSVIQKQHFDFAGCFRVEDQKDIGFETIFTRIGFDQAWIQERIATPLNVSSRPKESFYTPDLARQVHSLFEADFHAFGYREDQIDLGSEDSPSPPLSSAP